mgnify:CR=1 FL=1
MRKLFLNQDNNSATAAQRLQAYNDALNLGPSMTPNYIQYITGTQQLSDGLGSVAGPVLGAAAFHGLEIGLMHLTDYWRAALGLMIVLLVLFLPKGLLSLSQKLPWARKR